MLSFVDAKHPTFTSKGIRDFILKSSSRDTDLAHPKSMVQCRNRSYTSRYSSVTLVQTFRRQMKAKQGNPPVLQASETVCLWLAGNYCSACTFQKVYLIITKSLGQAQRRARKAQKMAYDNLALELQHSILYPIIAILTN